MSWPCDEVCLSRWPEWIEDTEKDLARVSLYTLVDAATVFITHLSEVLKQQSAQLLTRAKTDKLLQRILQQQPGLLFNRYVG